MSIITAIFQAILQALTYILPVSESGHSAIFHDFAGRADGTVTSLTGVIHIGIAIGIFAAFFKVFARYATELFTTGRDIVKKQFSFRAAPPVRKSVMMLLVSFVPMLLWLIPLGKFGMLYRVLKATAYNNTLLDDGVFLAMLGALVFLCARQLSLKSNNRPVTLPAAITAGACSLFFAPVSGLALFGGVFAVLVLFRVKPSAAFRHTLVMNFFVLVVTGIVQICAADYKSSIVALIIGLMLSVPVSFIAVRVLRNLITKGVLTYIAYYDVSIGLITAVIGAVQLIVR